MSHSPKRLKQNQPTHDEFVKSVASQYKQDGYKVYADCDGFEKPESINGHVPDVHAVPSKSMADDDDAKEILVEVETCDTCDDEGHTRTQYQTFARWCRENDALFEVGIPTSCLGRAQRSANTWGIKVHDWWQFPG